MNIKKGGVRRLGVHFKYKLISDCDLAYVPKKRKVLIYELGGIKFFVIFS